MVCLPMGRDQDDTAARVVHHGAGVRLSPKSSARAIASAVERVLGDANYRSAARKLGALIAEECSPIDIAVEIERRTGIHPARRGSVAS